MELKVHKEGKKIIIITLTFLVIINGLLYLFLHENLISYLISLISILLIIFILRFFRKPDRIIHDNKDIIYSAADGKIVAIENVFEDEYFNDNRKLISVFMSIWNVHINWFPVKSKIKYFKYHPGKYLMARHPKSSILNERATTVVETEDGTEIMIRQIAGFVARRVVSYCSPGAGTHPGQEMGFIKFGSRVDIFLPLTAHAEVNIGDKVKGLSTALALLKKN